MFLAQDGVSRIHSQMDAAEFAEIYAQADDALRSASKREDFLAFMGAVRRKLGKVQSAVRKGFFLNFNTSGTQVRLNNETKLDGGDATEEFL